MRVVTALLGVLALTALGCSQSVTLPKSELLKKPVHTLTAAEADTVIQHYQTVTQQLEQQLQQYNQQYDEANKKLADLKAALADCEKQLYQLIGATESDVEQFRQRLGVLEGKVREYQRYSDDELADRRSEVEQLENELWALRGMKISLLPEFYNRLAALGAKIKALYKEKKIRTYVVGTWARDRDCLWNIAGKPTIYNDPFLWPKIWLANDDQIRNPDLIYPGQILKIPPKGPKTPEEIKAERRYYRQKRLQQQQQAEQPSESAEPARAE